MISCLKIYLLKLFLNLILKTCSWKTQNVALLKKEVLAGNTVMLSCWHENLVFLACFFKSWPKKNFWVVSSTHRDSEIFASILTSWKYKLIKGSSTRGWATVLKKLIKVFSSKNNIVAITSDGPRGPAKKTKPGALKIALKKNITILGMSGKSSSYWTLNSWDKLKIPKPFSTITVSFGEKYSKGYDLNSFNNYLNGV